MQAAVDKFNKNYKLVWKEGGTYDKVYTIGNPDKPTPSGDAGIKTETDGLKVNDSTFTILPKIATVTITGNRQYGDTMNTSSDTPYSTTTNKILDGASAASLDKTAGTYNINIDGLTNGDDEHVLDSKKTKDLLSKIDNKDGTVSDAKDGKKINPYTDVARDTTTKEAVYQNINGFEKSKVSVVNDVVTDGKATNQMKVKSITIGEGDKATTTYDNPDSILTSNNYDYILQDGTHQLKITPVDIHVKVEGSKTYGDFTSQAATDYTASVSGGVSFNPTQTGKITLKTGEVADIVIANNLDEKRNAGTYTYDSSNPIDASKAFTVSLTDDTANTDKNDYNAANYNISFDTTYTINQAELWYTYKGSRDYGADNTTTQNTFKLVGVDGADSNERVRGFLKSWDVDAYKVDTANGNTIALTPGGADAATLYTMTGMANDAANKQDDTIRSITGGNSDSTYSHVIVDKDGKVIGYNLSSLGLSPDDKLSLKDTAKNSAFKNNYKLVWKPQVTGNAGETGTLSTSRIADVSVHTADGKGTTVQTKDVTVDASTLTLNPVNLTVEVTGKRQYGHTMDTDSYTTSTGKARVTANGVNVSRDKNTPDTFLDNGTYNLNLNGLVANDDERILNEENVKKKLLEVEEDGKNSAKINKYTDVKQNTNDNLATKLTYHNDTVHAFNITKKDGNTEQPGSQITVTDTTDGHYDLLKDGNYDYKLVDGTHTLTIDRQDLNLDIKAERQYGDISNQQVVSDYKNDAKPSAGTSSYVTGVTRDADGLQNGETIDFTKSKVNLSQDFYKADVGTYQHDWYNDDTDAGYSNGTAGITSIALEPTDSQTAGQSKFDPKNYNIHYTTTYTIDKADLYYTYDGERNYGQENSAATHTYTIVGKDDNSATESVRGYLKSWDSGVLADGNVLHKDLLTVTNESNGAYTMTGVADGAANITEPDTSKSIVKNDKDGGYSHVIVDGDGNIISYTLDSFGTKIAGNSDSTDAMAKTLAKNYNLVWKQGGESNKLNMVYTTDKTNKIDENGMLQAATDTSNQITVNNSSFKINPLALNVTVTGQRDYGEHMDVEHYVTSGSATDGHYKIEVNGSFADGESVDTVLNATHVKDMLASLENDKTTGDDAATRENSNGQAGKISKYTDVKRNETDRSKIDSYSFNVGSADTGSTITLASDVTAKDGDKVTSFKHADSKTNGFNVLNDNNYDYVISEGTHTLTINPVNLTVDVKGESTYGKTDTKYTVTGTGAKNGETMIADSGTLSNLAANSAAGSYKTTWQDKTGAGTSSAAADIKGKYLTTAERRSKNTSSVTGKDTADGIRTVQLKAGENTDNSGLSTFNSNNYNITYNTTQVINPAKLTITIDGKKVYGSTTGNISITGVTGNQSSDSLGGLRIDNNMGQLTDVGVYHHNWTQSAGLDGYTISGESYTYDTAAGKDQIGTKDAASWITGVTVADPTKFDFNNYDIDFQSTYEVTKRPLQLDVTSKSVYGDTGYTYTATALDPTGNTEDGLVGNQKFNPTDIQVTDDITAMADAGTYTHTATGTSYSDASGQPKNSTYNGITAVASDSLKDADNTGFKSSNYDITLHQGTHEVTKRTVRATVSGKQVYGEQAPTNGDAYQIAFEMSGDTGVNAHEGLANEQKIADNQVTVQNSVGKTNDVGTYTTLQSDVGEPIAYGKKNPERVDGKDQGIYGITVKEDGNGFKNNNYNIVLKTGSYTVKQRPVTFLTTGSRTYGEKNSTVTDYTVQQRNPADASGEGLTGPNKDTVTAKSVMENSTTDFNHTDWLMDAGTYGTESKSAQVLNIDPAVRTILGDDYKNYAITYQDKFTINQRTVRVTIDGESTYGDAARTAGTDYKTIDFEQAGAHGVASQEGLVAGQTIEKSQVTVLTDGIGATTDAGTYYLSQGAGTPGISRITVTDGNGFQNKNYHIVIEKGTYTVNKRPLALTIKGEKTYGDSTSLSGRDYTVSQSGLQNNEKIDFNDATVVHSMETGDRFSNAGEYHSSDNKGILGFDDSTLHGDGFKLGNYELTYDTVFVIDKRPVDVYMESRRTSGSPSSLRMDAPMTMRNVPQEHQGRFLSDLQILDTSPQVIAAGDYPGFDGTGYLDLNFAGDIYRNYMIHRHTVYHILPDRMMKPSVYNAVQPVRRPILDVMYLKVDGSEGINRWNGVQTPKDDGAIILKDGLGSDRTSQSHQPDQLTRPVLSESMGDFHEEVSQAIPVVYTDGENKELGGRYHLAYENDAVVVRPTTDTAEVPSLRAASVAQEEHKVLHVPYQGAEGEYAVAYADGIIQLYPKNDVARRLAQSKGTDEQLLLRSGLASAVQEFGVQLEDIEAVYIFTK